MHNAGDCEYSEVKGFLGDPSLNKVEYVLANGGGKILLRLILIFTMLGSIFAGILLLTNGEKNWEPIGNFPDQTVASVTEDVITVVGVKCYNESLTIRGQWGWASIEPPGIAIPVGKNTNFRDLGDADDDGCIITTFENPVPDEVLEHPEVIIWIISGTEIPVSDADGRIRNGLSNSWKTNPFQYPPIFVEADLS